MDLLFDQAKADLKADKIKLTASLQETLDNAGTNPVKVREALAKGIQCICNIYIYGFLL